MWSGQHSRCFCDRSSCPLTYLLTRFNVNMLREWWRYRNKHFGGIQLLWRTACCKQLSFFSVTTNPCKIFQLNFCGCKLPNASKFDGKKTIYKNNEHKTCLIWSFHKWVQLYSFFFCLLSFLVPLNWGLNCIIDYKGIYTSRYIKRLSLPSTTVPSFGIALIQSKLQIQLLQLSRADVCAVALGLVLAALLLLELRHWNL
jgi:hypothetical protein